MARRLGGDARHFRPNAVEKRTLRRFRCRSTVSHASTFVSKIFKPEKSNRFQNYNPPKLYNDSFSLGKFNREFIFLLKRLEK